MKTTLHLAEVKERLRTLGYYAGEPGPGDVTGYRAAVKRFQHDMHLRQDGDYGPLTESALLSLDLRNEVLEADAARTFRRFRITKYWVGTDRGKRGKRSIPMLSPAGVELAKVTPETFVEAALEGTTILSNGSMLNVGHRPSYRRCDPRVMQPVFAIAKRNDWIPQKAGYAGIRTDGRMATHARTFERRSRGPNGWPIERKIELDPYRTCAGDIGAVAKSDPRWKKKGGITPPGTRVFLLELVGKVLPDDSVHDGWLTVNDCGGGIFGAHIDVFTGYRAWARAIRLPDICHLWYEGIEKRIPDPHYEYGLEKE